MARKNWLLIDESLKEFCYRSSIVVPKPVCVDPNNCPQGYCLVNGTRTQGNRTLVCRKSGPNAVEDGLIPACAEALASDVIFHSLVSL